MAKLDGISEIASLKSNIAIDMYKTLHRAKSYPLDSTEIFTSYEDAVKYAKGEATGNKYQTAIASYPGLHITVVDVPLSTATMYQIQNISGDLKQIATTDHTLSIDTDEAGNITVKNDEYITFSNTVEAPHLVVSNDDLSTSLIDIANQKSDIKIDGSNEYLFGEGFYDASLGPNKNVTSADIYKTYIEDETTCSVDIIATRRWTDDKKVDKHTETINLDDYTLGLYLTLIAKNFGGNTTEPEA